MNIVDKLYTDWAWRCKTGTPDINNPEDKAILESILSGLNIPLKEDTYILEADGNEYDQVIALELFNDKGKIEDIPGVSRKYVVGKNDTVHSDDKKVFTSLFQVTPPKVGKEVGSQQTRGAGNGEVALYWLLSRSGVNVQDGRGKDAPDLRIDGTIGLEVKSYGERIITLGRFGNDYDTRKKLGYVLGLDVLISNLTGTERAPSIDSFNKEELIRGFGTMAKFSSDKNLREASTEFELIRYIYSKIDSLTDDLGLDKGFKPREGAASILRQLLTTKAENKPGFGGYIVDISAEGKMQYHQVTKEKIDSLDDETILKYVNANGSALKIYPDELFGK